MNTKIEILINKEEEKTLDLITTPLLRAIIFSNEKFAIITNKTNSEISLLLDNNDITYSNYIDICFSPSRAIPDLNYILADDIQKKQYAEIFNNFRNSFVNFIYSLSQSEKYKSRAQQLILTWKDFSKMTNSAIYTSNTKFVYETPIQLQILRLYNELIIKYLTYIACWELTYVKGDLNRIINNFFNLYVNKYKDSTVQTDYDTGRIIFSKRFASIKNMFPESIVTNRQETLCMYESIHKNLSIPQGVSSSKVDFYRKENGLKSHTSTPKLNTELNATEYKQDYLSLCSIAEKAFLVDGSLGLAHTKKDFKRKLFDNLIKCNHDNVIGGKLCDIFLLATDIVTFNTIRFNADIDMRKNKLEYTYENNEFMQNMIYTSLIILPCLYCDFCDESNYSKVNDFSKYLFNTFFSTDVRDKYSILHISNWNNDRSYARKYITSRNNAINKIFSDTTRNTELTPSNPTFPNSLTKKDTYIFYKDSLSIIRQEMESLLHKSLNAISQSIS